MRLSLSTNSKSALIPRARATRTEERLTLISGFSKNCRITFRRYSKLSASSAEPFARAVPPRTPVAALARDETLADGEMTWPAFDGAAASGEPGCPLPLAVDDVLKEEK